MYVDKIYINKREQPTWVPSTTKTGTTESTERTLSYKYQGLSRSVFGFTTYHWDEESYETPKILNERTT